MVEYEIKWARDGESMTVTASGKATVEELDECVQAILTDPRYRSGLRILYDQRRADRSHVAWSDVRRRAELLARDAERIGRPRIAFVVVSKVDFGLLRMTELLSDGRWQAVVRIFDDIDDARAWLWAPD